MKITKGYLKEQHHTAKKAKDTNLGGWCLKEFIVQIIIIITRTESKEFSSTLYFNVIDFNTQLCLPFNQQLSLFGFCNMKDALYD